MPVTEYDMEGYMNNEKVYKMEFSKIYPLLVNKAVKKGRSKEEVDEVFWVEIGELEKILQDPAAKYCVYIEEIQGIKRYL